MKLIYPESSDYFEELICAEYPLEGRSFQFSIDLNNDEHPDCKVGDFSNNCWFRTPYGINEKKYSSVAHMKSAVERLLHNKGFINLEWIKKEY